MTQKLMTQAQREELWKWIQQSPPSLEPAPD